MCWWTWRLRHAHQHRNGFSQSTFVCNPPRISLMGNAKIDTFYIWKLVLWKSLHRSAGMPAEPGFINWVEIPQWMRAALRRKDEHRGSLFRLLYWLMFLCLRNTSQKAGGGHDALSPSFRFAGLWRICKSARDPSSFTFPYPIPFVPEGKSIVASMT